MTTDFTFELASFAANATFSTLSNSFAALLPVFFLDTFAVMLAGSVQPVYQSTAQAITRTYGHGATGAAYIALDGKNSSLSGQMLLMGLSSSDFEYEHNIEGAQPASAVLPSLLCLAAEHHNTGKEFLAALGVGYELATRIAAATTLQVEEVKGFHAAGLAGPATAAAVGTLLGWNESTIASAMGIAASSSSGLLAYLSTGADTRRLHPARAGQLAVEAALMADAGVLGPRDVLENPQGYFNAFSNNPKPRQLTSELGTTWTSAHMALKLAPIHVWAQGFAFAIDNYRQETNSDWDASDISNVTIFAGPAVLDPMRWITEPQTLMQAQYSVPFGIAAALTADIHRNPLCVNESLVGNHDTRRLTTEMRKVEITDDPGYTWGYMTFELDGKAVNITADTYPGLPGSPGYARAVDTKFGNVVRSMGVENQAIAVKERIDHLADVEDMASLLEEMIAVGKLGVANVLARE